MVESQCNAAGSSGEEERDINDVVGRVFAYAVRIKQVAAGVQAIHDIDERQKIRVALGKGPVLPEQEMYALRSLVAVQALHLVDLASEITELLFDYEVTIASHA